MAGLVVTIGSGVNSNSSFGQAKTEVGGSSQPQNLGHRDRYGTSSIVSCPDPTHSTGEEGLVTQA